MKTMRFAAVAAAVAAVAVGLAGSAWAEPLSGDYTWVITETDFSEVGSTSSVLFTSCGPDCVTRESKAGLVEFHLQGNTWSRSDECVDSFDAVSLAGHMQCSDGYLKYQMSKKNN